MILDIRKSIMKTLKTNFANHKVYGEKVEQGLVRPCFFVDIIPVDIEKLNSEMQRQLITVDIQYMSKEDTKEKNLEMATFLPQVFNQVDIEEGKQIQVTEEKFEIIDGILHYLFDLDFLVELIVDEELPMIGEINIKEVE